MASDIEIARRTLEAEGLAFALVRDGRVLGRGHERGVRELLATVDALGASVRGASLADKVIGKAVALIVVEMGLREVDTAIASQAAVDFLHRHQVPLVARTVVPFIANRRGDGPCPMEHTTMPHEDAAAGLAALRAFFAQRG